MKAITLKTLKTRVLNGESPMDVLMGAGYSYKQAVGLFFGLLDNNEYFNS